MCLHGNIAGAWIPAVQQFERRSKPHAVQLLVTALLLIVLGAAYVAAMRALLGISRIEAPEDAVQRDQVYAAVHIAFLALSAMTGFFAGKWLNGLGLAYATLFFLVLLVFMVGVQLTTYELACRGHNDLVRHWQC